MTLIWPLKVIKGHKVNWKILYDFEYVIHTNIGYSMHRFWDVGLNRQKSKLDLSDIENKLTGVRREDRYCRVGSFPEARPAYWEAPETLRPTWVFTLGEIEVRGMWVFSPGETPDVRKVGVSPGETVVARNTGVPRTGWIIVGIGLLLYKLGLSANSQEVLSTCMNALFNYYCIWSA